MTIGFESLLLYALAMLVVFLTPGPVWVALTARTLSAGFAGAWSLTVGVALGDVFWPLLAILSVNKLASFNGEILTWLRFGGALIFIVIGCLLIIHRKRPIEHDSRLTRPGQWAGFLAGLMVILGNPKAIIFYMGVLPGFFDLSHVALADIIAICLISSLIPFVCNLAMIWLVARIRTKLTRPRMVERINIGSGLALIGVGLVIVLTAG